MRLLATAIYDAPREGAWQGESCWLFIRRIVYESLDRGHFVTWVLPDIYDVPSHPRLKLLLLEADLPLEEWLAARSSADVWIPLGMVLGTSDVPAAAAQVIRQAIDAMEKAGDVRASNRWEALEYLCADYLGSYDERRVQAGSGSADDIDTDPTPEEAEAPDSPEEFDPHE